MKFEHITKEEALARARQAEATLNGHGLTPRQMIADAGCTCCVPSTHGLYYKPEALYAWEAWERYMFLAGEETDNE